MGLFNRKKEEKSMLPNLPESSVELPKLLEYNDNDFIKGDNSFGADDNLNMNYDDNMQKSNFEPLPTYPVESTQRIIAEPFMRDNKIKIKENLGELRTFEVSGKNFGEERIKSSVKELQPVYIRLDNFKIGLDSFEDIKNKVVEIEDLLSKIKEVRNREEKELTEWEREIQIVKARIEQINKDIFKNVE